MARGPSLTFFMIGMVVFVGVLMLVYSSNWGIYNSIMLNNNQVVDSDFAQAMNNITGNQDSLTTWGDDFQELSIQSVWSTGTAVVSGSLTVLSIGVSAIRKFATLPDFFNAIFNGIGQYTGIPAPIFWMATIVMGIWFGNKIVKALRASIDDA